MIRISQLKLPYDHSPEALLLAAAKELRVPSEAIRSYRVVKRSIDARKKDNILFIYTLDVETDKEERTVKRSGSRKAGIAADRSYIFPASGSERLSAPPLIVGSGPAGLFCGLMLAQAGYGPVILERGARVDRRRRVVEDFWRNGILDPRTNVQFGEGGAGTFSDGKLNTVLRDPAGRGKKVLDVFVEHGADPSILWDARPHIGTDVLAEVVKNIRNHIIALGGRVMFETQMTGLTVENGRVTGIRAESAEGEKLGIPARAVVLAIGHSARDTFSMLHGQGVPMEPKPFAVGLRIQHPQKMIDESQYGRTDALLGPASYKLTHQTAEGRGVYSFCMCPGGYVVDASSEEGFLAVNGMSNHGRDGKCANSALIVTVTPADFGESGPLAGIGFQRRLEEKAFLYGNGRIPVQLFGDFRAGRRSLQFGDVEPQFMGRTEFADLREVLPRTLSEAISEGILEFEKKIHGFSRYDAILAGVESRTSSPVRILRGDDYESGIRGLFPCGEGAGYAGGITSAAMDGIKVAEEIAARYRPN